MNKHTEGEWEWHDDHFGGAIIKDEFGNVIARIPDRAVNEPGLRMPREDARLMCSSPKLLALLQRAGDIISRLYDVIETDGDGEVAQEILGSYSEDAAKLIRKATEQAH